MNQFTNPHPTFAGWTPLPSSPGAGPSSPVPPPILNGVPTASAATNSTRQHRNRLPKDAYKILRNFYNDVTSKPSKSQRIELAEKVRSTVRGCEDYSSRDVSGYFTGRRKRKTTTDKARQEPEPTALSASEASPAQILYPSLAKGPTVIPRLEVLLEDDPDPSEEIAAIWAEQLRYHAKAKDILTFAKLRRARKLHSPTLPPPTFSTMPPLHRLLPSSAPRTQASHLPTPSTSPEPTSLPTSPVVENTGIIGRIAADVSVKEEVDELDSDSDMELDSDSDSEVEVPLSATVAHMPTAIPSHVQHDLVTSLQKVFSQPRPPPGGNDATAPRSFAQLSRWIGAQDQATTAFLEEISQGKYAHLGLKPAASSAAHPRT
uniref:Efflux pump membrane transporter n=1 Tax=Ganoderma boninense TaxID=34458 RepID=A0A5K1JT85_9APHY|nr:Efflux pump membrane transporter [Ganoderma boninense]